MKTKQPYSFIFFLLITFLGMGLLGLQPSYGATKTKQPPSPPSPEEVFLKSHFGSRLVSVSTEGRPHQGDLKAPIQLITFNDFQCPFCKIGYLSLKPILKEYAGKINLTVFNYPLHKDCNPSVRGDFHPDACLAAKATFCALDQNKYWEYHDLVYDNQEELSSKTLKKLAKAAKLDQRAWSSCLNSPKTTDFLLSDIKQGDAISIRGTPTFIINGRVLNFTASPLELSETLKLVFQEELKKSSIPSR